jgi:hypothetical protein
LQGGSLTRHAFAWQCTIQRVCIEVQVQQLEKPDKRRTTLLWYRVENRATFEILAGTWLPVEIVNSAFKVVAGGKSAVLDHPNARVTWHAIGDPVTYTSAVEEHSEYARATAEGVVARHKISATNRTSEAGNPLDGAQLDQIVMRSRRR